jgi:hypothetical protein
VLAPGDGEAEPGVTATNFREPAKLATDGSQGMKILESSLVFHVLSVAHFAGSNLCWVSVPQARLRHRLGLALSPPASQAH